MKVYVSSTSVDLQDYRKAVIEILHRSGHTPICMEYHGVADVTPKDEVIKDVSDCDAYVGIFAWRYGYVPLGSEISITETEYRTAVEKKIPVLVFLLDENVQWSDEFRDTGEKGQQIKKLRDELQESKWIGFFSNPDNLAKEVIAAVSVLHNQIILEELRHARNASQEDLKTQAATFERLREEQKRKKKKKSSCVPEKATRYFKDRESELSKLRQCLLNKNLRMVLIYGRAGVGKTSLAAKFAREMEADFDNLPLGNEKLINVIYVTFSDSEDRSIDRIVERISGNLDEPDAAEVKDLWNQKGLSLNDRIAELFRGPLSRYRYLIVLDNLESVMNEDNQITEENVSLRQFIDAFFEHEHSALLVATSRRTLSLSHDAEIGAIGRRIQISLDEGLPESFAIALLRELDYDNRLGIGNAPKEILAEVVRRCQYIPRTLETLITTLLHRPTWDLDTLLANEAYFAQLIENPSRELYNSLSSEQERLVMKVLAIYEKPVPAAAINYILPALPIDEILNRFVLNFVANFDHGLFSLHPLDRFYAYNQIPDQGEEHSKPAFHRLAAQFYEKLRKPQDSWKTIDDVEPQLNEFRHLVQAELYDDACRLLNEIDREYLSTWGYSQEIIKMRSQMLGQIKDRQLGHINLGHLGSAYLALGNLAKSKEYYEQALEIAREVDDASYECRWLGNLGTVYANYGEYKKEEELLSEALEIAKTIHDRLHEGRWLTNLTQVRQHTSKISIEKAVEDYLEAISITKETGDHRFEMISYEWLGNLYINAGDFHNAKEQLKNALSAARQIGARSSICRILLQLGEIYERLEETTLQNECIEQARQELGGIHRPADSAEMLIKLAAIYSKQGKTRQQMDCYNEALQIAQNNSDRKTERRLLFIMGDESVRLGEKDKAVDYYRQALENARDASEYVDEINSLLRLAWVADRSGQENESARNYEEAHKVTRNTGNRSDEAIVLNAHANALLNSGKATEAIKYYEKAVPILKEMDDKASLTNILNRLGMAAYYLKDPFKAIEYYQQSLIVAREREDQEGEAIALYNVGDAYHLAGNIEKAVLYYKESLSLDSPSTNYVCASGMGIAYSKIGLKNEAESHFNKCIEIIQGMPQIYRSFHPHLCALALSLIAVGKAQEGLDIYREGLKFSPIKEHLHYAIEDLELLQSLPEPFAGIDEAIELIRKSFD